MPSKSFIYLTYGDIDSPVFSSQVVAFCRFLETSMELPVQLVCFVPLRLYREQKKKLARHPIKCQVYPVVNRWQSQRWYSRLNAWLLSLLEPGTVMTRNAAAVHVCTALQKRGVHFIYDARGCSYVEMKEFSDASSRSIETMKKMEKLSFAKADWIYSVSKALIDHVKLNFLYRDHNHSIIPCCSVATISVPSKTKKELFATEDVTVYCYAGALTVWNFPRSFLEVCRAILAEPKNRLIILSHQFEVLDDYPFLHTSRSIIKKVLPEEVSSYLKCTDYAILLRKKAVTNQVASPSKFADYISAGCKVIISPGIGDLSELVVKEDLGLIYKGRKDDGKLGGLKSLSMAEREHIKSYAKEHFMRESDSNMLKYRNLKKIHEEL